ncbi:MAG: DMT family transporter [Pseudomonadota bacterium]
MAPTLLHLYGPLLIGACAVAMGVSIDVYVKYLALQAPLIIVITLRFLFGGAISVAIFLVPKKSSKGTRERRALPSREACVFHIGRAFLQLATAYLFFYGLTKLPLATATVFGFSAALMVPFIAWPLLKEKPTLLACVATLAGFSGTAVAAYGGAQAQAGPIGQDYIVGVVSCLVAAFIYAVILVMLRMRAGKEDAATMSLFTNIVPGVLLLPALFIGEGPSFLAEMVRSGLILHTVALSSIAYAVWFLMSIAYARAPAQQLAPLEYTALIWSATAGYVVFGEQPVWQIWAGGAIVIAACLTVAAERHLSARKNAQMPASTLPD